MAVRLRVVIVRAAGRPRALVALLGWVVGWVERWMAAGMEPLEEVSKGRALQGVEGGGSASRWSWMGIVVDGIEVAASAAGGVANGGGELSREGGREVEELVWVVKANEGGVEAVSVAKSVEA